MTSTQHLVLCLTMAVAFVAAGFTLAQMYRAERAMQRTGGPGLVPFERAESAREVDRYLRTWGPAGRAAVRRSLSWNYGFLTAYVVIFVAAALQVAGQADAAGYRLLAVVEVVAAGAAVLAGCADIVENVMLRGTLAAHDKLSGSKDTEPVRYATTSAAGSARITLTRRAAAVKFILTGGVSAVVLIGFGIVELSGQPTPAGPMLSVFAGVIVATATFGTAVLRPRA
jgi:hypothetical protein